MKRDCVKCQSTEACLHWSPLGSQHFSISRQQTAVSLRYWFCCLLLVGLQCLYEPFVTDPCPLHQTWTQAACWININHLLSSLKRLIILVPLEHFINKELNSIKHNVQVEKFIRSSKQGLGFELNSAACDGTSGMEGWMRNWRREEISTDQRWRTREEGWEEERRIQRKPMVMRAEASSCYQSVTLKQDGNLCTIASMTSL